MGERSHWLAVDPPPGLSPVAPIGGSATFIVYRAVRLSDSSPVIVKAARREPPSVDTLTRLERERAVREKLNTDHVHPLAQDFPWDPVAPAVVLEDRGGSSLARRLRDGPLTLRDALAVTCRILRCLESVHRVGVVHGDVTPENIIWNTKTSRVILTDFDWSSAPWLPPSLRLDISNFHGNPAYAPPEQSGRLHVESPPDARADLYSLGAMFYELLTGAPPFGSSGTLALIRAHVAQRSVPAHVRTPDVPRAVSDIVAKLLDKAPEQRYQTARGVRADVERCERDLVTTGRIGEFRLGDFDIPEHVNLSTRLYGREYEIGLLRASLERCAAGACEVMHLSGPSGIGKTRLACELVPAVSGRGALFVSGKFDQRRQVQSFAPLISLIHHVARDLTSDPENVAEWSRRLSRELGASGAVLVNWIPSLAELLGTRPHIVRVEGEDARNQLVLAVSRLFRALGRTDAPLVLLLDDVQWADEETLEVIEDVVLEGSIRHLLLLLAFRDDDPDAVERLQGRAARLTSGNVPVHSLSLQGIGLADQSRLIADTLQTSSKQALALLDALRMDGLENPFRLRQIVSSLAESGLLRLDPDTHEWQWHLDELAADAAGAVRPDPLGNEIARLPARTVDTLSLFANMGGSLRVDTLAIAASCSEAELENRLVPALDARLLLMSRDLPTSEHRLLRFVHDQVQAACLAVSRGIDPRSLHLEIARRLLDAAGRTPSDELVSRGVDHLCLALDTFAAEGGGGGVQDLASETVTGRYRAAGRVLIDDQAQRRRFCELAMLAASRARRATAFGITRRYLEAAFALLADACWEHEPELAGRVHLELAQALLHRGDEAGLAAAARLARQGLGHLRDPDGRAAFYEVLIATCYACDDLDGVLDRGREALLERGIELPAGDYATTLEAELNSLMKAIEGRPQEVFAPAPAASASALSRTLQLMMSLLPATHAKTTSLNSLITVKMVQLSVDQGAVVESAKALVNLGTVLAEEGDTDRAFQFARMGQEMVEVTGYGALRARILFTVSAYLLHWGRPVREADETAREALEAAIELGDRVYEGFIRSHCLASNALFISRDLVALQGDLDDHWQFAARTANVSARRVIEAVAGYVSCVLGEASDPLSMDSTYLPGEELAASCAADPATPGGPREGHALCLFFILRAQLRYLHRRYRDADSDIRAAAALKVHLSGTLALATLTLLDGLIAAALARQRVPARLERALSRFAAWSKTGGENFSDAHALLAAEHARLKGSGTEALVHYSEAARHGVQAPIPIVTAIASERAATLCELLNLSAAAAGYQSVALSTYLALSMHSETRRLRDATSEPDRLGADTSRARSARQASTTSAFDVRDVELRAVFSAFEKVALAGSLHEMLVVWLGSLLDLTGAQRAVLITADADELSVRVEARAGEPGIETLPPGAEPLSRTARVPRGVVQEVISNGTALILPRAHEGVPRGTGHAMLCAPLHHQRSLVGVVFLENRLVGNSFSPKSLETVQVLSWLAATAMRIVVSSDALARESARAERLSIVSSFVPPEVVSRVLESGEDSWSTPHRKLVAVLFCDLRGFTAYCEQAEPEEVFSLLDRYHRQLDQVIAEFRGTVDHRAGDGLMVVLHDFPTAAAVAEAAIALAREMHSVARELIASVCSRSTGTNLGFAVGVNMGHATLGVIGERGGRAFIATGRVVNLASRLCDRAAGGETIVGPQLLLDLGEDSERFRSVNVNLKGFGTTIRAGVCRFDRREAQPHRQAQ